MNRSPTHSISRRLTLMSLLVAGTALGLTSTALFVYDWFSFRDDMARDLSIQARIVGENTVSALVFDDPEAATTTLSALGASPNVISAAVARTDGEVLAVYLRRPDLQVPPVAGSLRFRPGTEEVRSFSDGTLMLARQVIFGDEPIGAVYIWSDLLALNARISSYMTIVAGVAAVSLIIALLISTVSRRAVSEPIVHLAEIAGKISRDKDYSLRADPMPGRDELSLLATAFNEMLERVATRDMELEAARNELESRVEERTVQLADANRELETFSYSVSHDLRAPLRHLDGFSSLLESQYGPEMPAPASRYLTLIRESAQQMGRLIDDLLALARISRQRVSSQPVDMNDLVASVIRDLTSEIGERDIDWRISNLPGLECDPGLIRIVMTNLLSNAVKYTRRATPAVIEVHHTSDQAGPVIFVRDNGAGFDQQYAHKLFGVFQRLHRDEEFEGTGIGLATVQRILHAHGGRIWAEGTIDRGATFSFTLGSTPAD